MRAEVPITPLSPSQSSRLELTLFASFGARFDGERAEVAVPRRVVAILAYLVLRGTTPLRRDALAEAIWPDEAVGEARVKLRKYLHLAQKRLPPVAGEWIVSMGTGSLIWNPANPVGTDVADFIALHHARDYAASAALYTGPLLPELDDPWLVYERDALRNYQALNLGALIDDVEDPHLARTRLEAVRRLLDEDPRHEDLLRAAMEMLVRAGSRGEAVAFYLDYERRLREQFDTAPAPESYDLFRALAAATRPRRPMPDRSSAEDLPFVGRRRELGVLREAASEAERCAGSIVFCMGEAGIGKSRLVDEFLRTPELRHATVLIGRTSPTELHPYEAFGEALAAAVPTLEEISLGPSIRNSLGSLIPEMRLAGDAPSLETARDAKGMHDALYLVFGELSRLGAVVLVLEDLHAAQIATWEAVADLASRSAHLRLLVVATLRHEYDGSVSEKYRRRLGRTAITLPLGGLSVSDVSSLVARARGTENDVVASRLHERTSGNPLYLTELLRAVTGARGDGSEAPQSLRAAIVARLQRLGTAQRETTFAAAVMSMRFDVELLASVLEVGTGAVTQAVDSLVTARVFRRVFGTSLYEFEHDELRHHAYEFVDPAIRAHLHARAARALAEREGDVGASAASIAVHYEAGGDREAAAEWGVRAARRAFELHAPEESLRSTTHALGLARNEQTRWELQLLFEQLTRRNEDADGRSESIAELERIAENRGAGARAEILLRDVKTASSHGNREEERLAIERLAVVVGELDTPGWRARLALSWGQYYLRVGPFDVARDQLEHAVSLWPADTDVAIQMEALEALAETQTMCGRNEQAETTIGRARALADASGDQSAMLMVLRRGSIAAIVRRDFDAAHRLGLEAHAVATIVGDLDAIADSLLRVGAVETRRRNFSLAQEYLRRARSISERLGKRSWIGATLINEAIAMFSFGDFAGAAHNFREGRAVIEALGEVRNFFFLSINESDLAMLMGDFEVARAFAVEAMQLARQMGSELYESLAHLHLGPLERETGESERALLTLERGVELYFKTGMIADLAFFHAELALTHLSLGNLDRARVSSERATELYIGRHGGAPGDSPHRVKYAEARVMAALGDVDRARAAIREAIGDMAATVRKTRLREHRRAFTSTPLGTKCIDLARQLGVDLDDDVADAAGVASTLTAV